MLELNNDSMTHEKELIQTNRFQAKQSIDQCAISYVYIYIMPLKFKPSHSQYGRVCFKCWIVVNRLTFMMSHRWTKHEHVCAHTIERFGVYRLNNHQIYSYIANCTLFDLKSTQLFALSLPFYSIYCDTHHWFM